MRDAEKAAARAGLAVERGRCGWTARRVGSWLSRPSGCLPRHQSAGLRDGHRGQRRACLKSLATREDAYPEFDMSRRCATLSLVIFVCHGSLSNDRSYRPLDCFPGSVEAHNIVCLSALASSQFPLIRTRDITKMCLQMDEVRTSRNEWQGR
ncbi:hypothetical protein CCHR01_02993 [Colletotrichum chrysophilum]|uniref:Uncharacterized protein n=1 Tax=Colletotrichum chrysophilum TaxID=1836956 RepID=A0AAD9ENZ7_9PEZI|nr:hypothetical protein CCHR01_02993 [Colletotrichum chrysophilum]